MGRNYGLVMWSCSSLFPFGRVWGVDSLSSLTCIYLRSPFPMAMQRRRALAGDHFSEASGGFAGRVLWWHLKKKKLSRGMGKASLTWCLTPGYSRSNPAVGQGVFSGSCCVSAPSPAKQGYRYEWEGEKGRKGGTRGGLGDFLFYNAFEDINWSAKSLFLLSLQNLIWMPYSKWPVLLLSVLNTEVNLFNNAWAFKLTQHFLPFFSCMSFSMLARGFLMTLHEDFQCTLWTSLTVCWPMFMKALAWFWIFVMRCPVYSVHWMCSLVCVIALFLFKRIFWQKPVTRQRGTLCVIILQRSFNEDASCM